jgi:hypothetical protein
MIFLCACINSSSIFVFLGANKFLHLRSQFALVAELVDALDSKSSFLGSVGSIPTQGTQQDKSSFLDLSLFLFGFYPVWKISNNPINFPRS